MRIGTPQDNAVAITGVERMVAFLRANQACVIPSPTSTFLQGDVMATGRDKDRKTRKKHRKNVKRMKALGKARRGSKKGKKG
jgi:hypothetical protein